MAFVRINDNNFNVAPLTLGGVPVPENQNVDVLGQPPVCTWNGHHYHWTAGHFSSLGQLVKFYTITQANDLILVFTPDETGSPVTYRP